MLDGRVGFVTLPAVILARSGWTRSLLARIEIEVGPLVSEAFFIFDFDVQAHEVFLIVAVLVDRALRGRAVDLEYKDGLVRPGPASQVVVVGSRVHKNVREHLHSVASLLGITHAQP